jgi:hypothetical protein
MDSHELPEGEAGDREPERDVVPRFQAELGQVDGGAESVSFDRREGNDLGVGTLSDAVVKHVERRDIGDGRARDRGGVLERFCSTRKLDFGTAGTIAGMDVNPLGVDRVGQPHDHTADQQQMLHDSSPPEFRRSKRKLGARGGLRQLGVTYCMRAGYVCG